MELYRDIDIDAITNKLDDIIDEANDVKKKTLEPTINECLKIKQVINEFIMMKKRIVYGGTAYNELIKQKKQSDAIYKQNDCKDIEFYSPKPIEDIMELADLLHEKKFKYVQAKQAMHAETYTIFVNFEQYCDVSYMSSNIFANMPIISINNIAYAHPTWILVDILRQYNDPITSYWRLKDKTFFRANKLLKHYPLEFETIDLPKYVSKHDVFKNKLFQEIAKLQTIIFVGSIAENYYLTRSSKVDTTKLEVISTNYQYDTKIIYQYLEKIIGSKIKDIVINSYKPYFQFRDHYVEFLLNGITIIKIFGANGKCIPYNILNMSGTSYNNIHSIQLGGHIGKKVINRNKKKNKIKSTKIEKNSASLSIKIGTFLVLFQHLLTERHCLYTNRSDNYKHIETILSNLLKERNNYLENKSLTVMDKSPYREFIVRCIGETIDQGREFRLALLKRRSQGMKLMFTYDPDGSKKHQLPEYKFANTSGNVDRTGVKKLFK